MDESAIIHRLNAIIVLLLIVIGMLLWSLLSSLAVAGLKMILLAFLVVIGGMVAWALWGLIDAVR
ncbi:hypothetical protein [Natronorubrum halophilum]|uniref:hypothetical protein n=1 Tax=Natronorubrum halophilum TaxID=1702106 RepID=UPI0010C1E6EE|nr:hypothetical protein [Natronorubrum halophilum]